jgi:hypothetical protein
MILATISPSILGEDLEVATIFPSASSSAGAIEGGSIYKTQRLLTLEEELGKVKNSIQQVQAERGLKVDIKALESVTKFDLNDLRNLKSVLKSPLPSNGLFRASI